MSAAFPVYQANNSVQSCSGISFKSQALYMLVYVTRYLGMLLNLQLPSDMRNSP